MIVNGFVWPRWEVALWSEAVDVPHVFSDSSLPRTIAAVLLLLLLLLCTNGARWGEVGSRNVLVATAAGHPGRCDCVWQIIVNAVHVAFLVGRGGSREDAISVGQSVRCSSKFGWRSRGTTENVAIMV